MMNSLWIAKTGMSAQQTELDVISHNLANVSTTGYKRNSAQFADLIYQNLRQVGANADEQNQLPTGLHLGLGVRTVATSRNFTQGTLQETQNSLDVAINGNGFFQVTMPDGTLAYTRAGSFQLDGAGRLVTPSGLPVANGITVPPGATNVSIATDGTVSAVLAGATAPSTIGTLAMVNFVNPAGLEPVGDNLYKESVASGTPQGGTPGTNGLGTIKQGFLENSNVNVVEELVNMIQTQRAYEMNSKAIQTADQMLAKLGQL
ncbi:flagellar basal-body rod protein FlgG [Extensimonas vulgaris]|uniref:Flagellar basal-body rod protein FlgF n=1 Tax=Extensimonas vulgaris TaxID=1031594 RepID=A0A369ARI8_9BURK|nr:flagellar basal-body rod protein FlgG [Extensimonas vulgaris]RCX10958.1 flagellar basal-body rod protein FlgG [Extensimonas vulgaris]TWI41632.1 flagellar basal-body rod protein FlgG [Extensimonas vulgaris]TXD16105.1 flagellar basal-body rod protein FlgG [Extensimonas vulgaris]